MRFRIHMTLADGTEDQIDVEGDTLEEVRNQARKEMELRNISSAWSEQIKEEVR